MNGVMFNVHTTTIAAYPSFVNVYNTYDRAVTYKFDVYEAVTGASLGSTTQVVQANRVFAMNSTVLHVFITSMTPATQNVMAHHAVFFTGSQGFLPTVIAMSHFCPVTQ